MKYYSAPYLCKFKIQQSRYSETGNFLNVRIGAPLKFSSAIVGNITHEIAPY